MTPSRAPDAAFWRGRRVLVTGHTGFKGSWLVSWLLAMGAHVTGFSDKVPTERALFDDLRLSDDLEDRRGDVRNLDAVRAAFDAGKPSVILHLAAQPLVRLSYDRPVETFATNVMGTVNVLEAARHQRGVEVVLIVTSDKCYENREWIWSYRETDAMGGHDPYSSSKGCSELVASAFARSFFDAATGPHIVSARAGNVFGGGDWALDRLIPDLVRGLETSTPVSIRHPDAVRPWQHVLEPLSGYLLLCEAVAADADLRSQGWNFGPDTSDDLSVRTVADLVCSLWPRPDGWVDVSDGHHRHEAHLLTLDSTKARRRLGWRSRWAMQDALAHTLAVYQSGAKGRALQNLVLSQIVAYSSGAAS